MNDYGKLAVRSVISGIVAGLIIGVLLFVVSAIIPTVELPAALVGFWSGVAVAGLSFLAGWNNDNRV